MKLGNRALPQMTVREHFVLALAQAQLMSPKSPDELEQSWPGNQPWASNLVEMADALLAAIHQPETQPDAPPPGEMIRFEPGAERWR